jgi:hypothetical protein
VLKERENLQSSKRGSVPSAERVRDHPGSLSRHNRKCRVRCTMISAKVRPPHVSWQFGGRTALPPPPLPAFSYLSTAGRCDCEFLSTVPQLIISLAAGIQSRTHRRDPMSSRAAPSHDAFLTKRRKVRKGTHSCWECKRRKMKCAFDPHIASSSCNGCRQRGSPCISQEFVDDISHVAQSGNDDASLNAPTPIATPSDDGRRACHSALTPVSIESEPSGHFLSRKSSGVCPSCIPSS